MRVGGAAGRGLGQEVWEEAAGVGSKGRVRGPIWSILALGVWHCVDPSEKE